MTTNTILTETQRQVLNAAADHPINEVVWFPDSVKGGARGKVLQSLASKGWITECRGHWFLACGAIDALERDVPPPIPTMPIVRSLETDNAPATTYATNDATTPAKPANAFDERYADVPAQANVEAIRVAGDDLTDPSQVLVEEIHYSDPTGDEINATNDIDPQIASATNVKPIRTRANSKQATVIAMLRRHEGATIDQIAEATGWQHHTIRGTFAGAFKKKLGLTITSEKAQGAQRVYRIENEA